MSLQCTSVFQPHLSYSCAYFPMNWNSTGMFTLPNIGPACTIMQLTRIHSESEIKFRCSSWWSQELHLTKFGQFQTCLTMNEIEKIIKKKTKKHLLLVWKVFKKNQLSLLDFKSYFTRASRFLQPAYWDSAYWDSLTSYSSLASFSVSFSIWVPWYKRYFYFPHVTWPMHILICSTGKAPLKEDFRSPHLW